MISDDELKALRAKWKRRDSEHAKVLTADAMEVLRLIDALEEVRREKTAQYEESRQVLRSTIATARALAFEEAALVCDSAQELADVTGMSAPHSVVAATTREKATLPSSLVAVKPCHICGSIEAVTTPGAQLCSRAHAAGVMNDGVVAVPREVVEQVKEALMTAHGYVNFLCRAEPDRPGYPANVAKVDAALKALEEVSR